MHFLQKFCSISSPSFQCRILSVFEGYGTSINVSLPPYTLIIMYLQVCSFFQQASQGRYVWSTVYKYCRLPRLPGPFPGQTARHLENSLTQSAKLQRNWASSPQAIVKPLCTQTFNCHLSNVCGTLLIGPWFVVAGSSQIVCYDMDSENSDGSIIYDAPLRIYSFSAAGALCSGEQCIAYIVIQENANNSQR